MKKTTLKDLSKALNLSCSAVSAAMNKRPNISSATQARVRKMADEMGYAPDARITQLMSYLRTGKSPQNRPNLAWLYWAKKSDDHESKPWVKGYLEGARKRATELGYAIDPIWLDSPNFPTQRLNSILAARGIKGVIFLNFIWPSPLLERYLDWSKFALASLEGNSNDTGIPHVGCIGVKSIQIVFENLLRLGYKRPGLVVGGWVNHSHDCHWTAGFLQQQRQLSEADRVPILESDSWQSALPEWMRAHRPDVVICSSNETIGYLNDSGFKVPEDVAVAHINVCSDVSGWAGIDELHEQIGSAAVDVVTAQLNRGEKGLNPNSKLIYIQGAWVDGWTCPPRLVTT